MTQLHEYSPCKFLVLEMFVLNHTTLLHEFLVLGNSNIWEFYRYAISYIMRHRNLVTEFNSFLYSKICLRFLLCEQIETFRCFDSTDQLIGLPEIRKDIRLSLKQEESLCFDFSLCKNIIRLTFLSLPFLTRLTCCVNHQRLFQLNFLAYFAGKS